MIVFFRSNDDSKSGNGPKRTASGKRLGRPPKKGTHLQSDSLGSMALSSGSTKEQDKERSPDRSSSSGEAKRRKQSPGARYIFG